MVATLLVAALENLQAIVLDCSARLENPEGHGLGVPTSELTILTKAEKKSLNRKLQKKRKKLSDPNAPKRPNSAYINYQAVRRAVAKEANPDVPYTELQKIIGEMWKNESEKVKKSYEEPAAEALAAWKASTAEYETGKALTQPMEDDGSDEDEDEDEEAQSSPQTKKRKKSAAVKEASEDEDEGNELDDDSEASREL